MTKKLRPQPSFIGTIYTGSFPDWSEVLEQVSAYFQEVKGREVTFVAAKEDLIKLILSQPDPVARAVTATFVAAEVNRAAKEAYDSIPEGESGIVLAVGALSEPVEDLRDHLDSLVAEDDSNPSAATLEAANALLFAESYVERQGDISHITFTRSKVALPKPYCGLSIEADLAAEEIVSVIEDFLYPDNEGVIQ